MYASSSIFFIWALTASQKLMHKFAYGGSVVKNPPAKTRYARDMGSISGLEDPLEEEIANHSSILAWRIPRTEEPGRLQSMGSQRGGHEGMTEHIHTFA